MRFKRSLIGLSLTISLQFSCVQATDAAAPLTIPSTRSEWEVSLIKMQTALDHYAQQLIGDPVYELQVSRLKELRREVESHGMTYSTAKQTRELQKAILLNHPGLRGKSMLYIKRPGVSPALPANWQSNSSLPRTGFTDQIMLAPSPGIIEDKVLFKSDTGSAITDMDLHFEGDRLLFSKTDSQKRWSLFEMSMEGGQPEKISLIEHPEVDNYDACYLPDGNIIFQSTATFIGVPCVYGESYVTNSYLLERQTGKIRQLTFDQEHNWNTVVMPNGKVVYQRWEYSGLAHSNSRLLMQMNPDGTGQMEFYGSGSYFPNSLFYPRPVPGTASTITAIITGHHGATRSGRLMLIDPAVGTRNADGMIHEFPLSGEKVTPLIKDRLVEGVWPQFLHPWPVDEDLILVSAKLSPKSPWGLYLVDRFDNMVLIRSQKRASLMEPMLVDATDPPPVIPPRSNPEEKEARVYLADIYSGPGLKGIERGRVKSLRLFTYHYSPRELGGLYGSIGLDGPWDMKRILGTVPVEEDGSAAFTIPANVPLSIQPLDEEGQALQLMRSWFVGMPGEKVSCVGCHESQEQTPLTSNNVAATKSPSRLTPESGKMAGSNFSFPHRVQPLLDRNCVGCHDGDNAKPDLRGGTPYSWSSQHDGNVGYRYADKRWSTAYYNLHRYIRQPGIESQLPLLSPMDFHADGSRLIQMLKQGHRGVRLSPEEKRTLIEWIDLNTPYYGNWNQMTGGEGSIRTAALGDEMRRKYAGNEMNFETLPPLPGKPVFHEPDAKSAAEDLSRIRAQKSILKQVMKHSGSTDTSALLAKQRDLVKKLGLASEILTVSGPDGEPMKFILVPAASPFWISTREISNSQLKALLPDHDSGFEDRHGYQFGVTGFPMNNKQQPAVKLSWRQAQKFCRMLSAHLNLEVRLPTEEEWVLAASAANGREHWFEGSDFGAFENLADSSLKQFANNPYSAPENLVPIKNPSGGDDFLLKDEQVNDHSLVTVSCGSYQPNPLGLYDILGNAAEWTSTEVKNIDNRPRKVLKGGSWRSRMSEAGVSARRLFADDHPVFDAALRPVIEISKPN